MFSVVTLKPRCFLTVEEKAVRDAEKALIARNIRLVEAEAIARSVAVNVVVGSNRSSKSEAIRAERSKAVKMAAVYTEQEKAARIAFKSDIAKLKVRLAASLSETDA
jgi:hypothetical protein